MNNDIFEKAFDAIDDELIADAKNPSIRIAARRKKIMLSSIAACIAAVLVAIPSIKILSDPNNKIPTDKTTETISSEKETNSSENASSDISSSEPDNTSSEPDNLSKPSNSASAGNDIQNAHAGSSYKIKMSDLYFTNISSNGATTTYEKIYTPDIKYLYINPLPNNKYADVYEEYYQNDFDRSEVELLTNKYFPKMAKTLNASLPSYEIKERFGGLSDSIKVSIDLPISFVQYDNRNIVSYLAGDDITLNGKTVTVNQAQNDQEILDSLSAIKQTLFDVFDVSFDNAKVNRKYSKDSEYGVSSLYVYFYNEDSHPLNSINYFGNPKSDFIAIWFTNTNSSTNLYNVFSIAFWSYRTDNNSPLRTFVKKELLPLKKAEEYLQKGYVLATGGCTLCQSEQTPVDFTDYDYVSFEYKGGSKTGDLTIPYYAFYKNIGTAPNGNMTFAKTYVPAVEVEGYEEYFINKHANH